MRLSKDLVAVARPGGWLSEEDAGGAGVPPLPLNFDGAARILDPNVTPAESIMCHSRDGEGEEFSLQSIRLAPLPLRKITPALFRRIHERPGRAP